jgi:hypothetical protein
MIMPPRHIIVGLSLLLSLAAGCHGQTGKDTSCLPYGPSVVRLTGTLIRQTFPGPPNYESVRKGDKPETDWLLDLSRPVCVDQDKVEPDLNPAQRDVRRVQLVVDETAYKTHKNLVGKQVVATGTLFGEHTGHHHTPVLLTVSTLSKTE